MPSVLKLTKPHVVLTAVSGAVMLVLATTGCAYLLFGPGGMYGCPVLYFTSLPPHDNPLSRAMADGVEPDRVEVALSGAVTSQYSVLGKHWPAEPQCEWIAAPGCRYRIMAKGEKIGPLGEREYTGCYLLDVAVAEESGGLPKVRKMGDARPMQCPAR